MEYTVKEIAELTGVTVKTLHHYHKIGLLEPSKMTEAGYRIYGVEQLQRLQQILFYRELDFSLKDIKKALEDEPSRIECLIEQQKLFIARKQRMDCVLNTIEESIRLTKKGESMDKTAMFHGLNKEEWVKALTEQNEYLKDKYEYDMLKSQDIQVEQLNEQALEAQEFMNYVANALKSGWKADDEKLQKKIKHHIEFLSSHGVSMDAKSFINSAKFFLQDDFHRNMLESQQIGLAYYLYAVSEIYSAQNNI